MSDRPLSPDPRSALAVFRVFLRLGLTSFGGPVAHLAYFREEFVARRRWLDDPAYGDLVALCQFLPGPASSQVGMALGLSQAESPAPWQPGSGSPCPRPRRWSSSASGSRGWRAGSAAGGSTASRWSRWPWWRRRSGAWGGASAPTVCARPQPWPRRRGRRVRLARPPTLRGSARPTPVGACRAGHRGRGVGPLRAPAPRPARRGGTRRPRARALRQLLPVRVARVRRRTRGIASASARGGAAGLGHGQRLPGAVQGGPGRARAALHLRRLPGQRVVREPVGLVRGRGLTRGRLPSRVPARRRSPPLLGSAPARRGGAPVDVGDQCHGRRAPARRLLRPGVDRRGPFRCRLLPRGGRLRAPHLLEGSALGGRGGHGGRRRPGRCV